MPDSPSGKKAVAVEAPDLSPTAATPTLLKDKSPSALNEGAQRPCAFCSNPMRNGVFKCEHCERRAYCSAECRQADWTVRGGGQGHSVWCDLHCGEEGLDWEVKEVEGKGLGLVAKRPLQKSFRIMVDPNLELDDWRVMDLMPLGGDRGAKVDLNQFGYSEPPSPMGKGEEETMWFFLCFKLSRANHNCDANAGYAFETDTMVGILFAEKDIEKGEEITIRYQGFNRMRRGSSNVEIHQTFLTKWEFSCPQGSICQREEILELIDQSRDLYEILETLFNSKQFNPTAVEIVEQLLENYERIGITTPAKAKTLYYGFCIALMKQDTIVKARDFLNRCSLILDGIFPRGKGFCPHREIWKRDLYTHPFYLIGEQSGFKV